MKDIAHLTGLDHATVRRLRQLGADDDTVADTGDEDTGVPEAAGSPGGVMDADDRTRESRDRSAALSRW